MSKGKACSNKNMNTILCILIVVLFLIAVWYVVFGNKSKEGFEVEDKCSEQRKKYYEADTNFNKNMTNSGLYNDRAMADSVLAKCCHDNGVENCRGPGGLGPGTILE